MNVLWPVPILSITSLSPEEAVSICRAILRSECAYSKLGPSALTISDKLMTPDGGIDAEVNAIDVGTVHEDCIFSNGITGFQIKAGNSFKPWSESSIKAELLNSKGELNSEVKRLIERQGNYTVISTGHDLTPKQRNDSIEVIISQLQEKGVDGYDQSKINVYGASQIAEFAERYPGVASQLTADPIQEAWTLEEWLRDSNMNNVLEDSSEQKAIINQINSCLSGEIKHIRILGEPGLGKTRIVLEAVKDDFTANHVLYIQHGTNFGQTNLFRQLIRSSYNKPLILVIDELPENSLSDIWSHLKSRCNPLKIISIDHGHDNTRDEDTERIVAPRLNDATIKNILSNIVGQSEELDRWVKICEGSPRVAQAVGENLLANPDDLLKAPTSIPLWDRFLHSYRKSDALDARQIDLVSQYLALFSRFGYEHPVNSEAEFIADQIRSIDHSIGWARFQEIIDDLRSRRVLQGSRTLFFVPKALHIYLWKQFWKNYSRGFNFTEIFTHMPESLHSWFMSMFKYAGEGNSRIVIESILSRDGVYSNNDFLISDKGSRFLSILTEAHPRAVLELLESSIGTWTDVELKNVKEGRQNLVWTLEKIAVWPSFTKRSIRLLAKLALNENATNTNNSTGTLMGLFRIGPEWAATEASPQDKLPALIELLRSKLDKEKLLGLNIMEAALDTRGGFRTIGPEYQGMRERANLWKPKTYGDWWGAYLKYFQSLVDETKTWPVSLHGDLCNTLLDIVKNQIRVPSCVDLCFEVLDILVIDDHAKPEKMNNFFWHWREYSDDGERPEITKKIVSLERAYTKRNLASRFNRYVLNVEWLEWDDDFRERKGKSKNRSKTLVAALAKRIAESPKKINDILNLLSPSQARPALWYFGERLADYDSNNNLLPILLDNTLETRHQVCLSGYFSGLRARDEARYRKTLNTLIECEETSWLGVSITINTEYDEELFSKCLSSYQKGWINSNDFRSMAYGKLIEQIPDDKVNELLGLLEEESSVDSQRVLIDLLYAIVTRGTSPISANLIFNTVSSCIPKEKNNDTMNSYYWKKLCEKLIQLDAKHAIKLLDILFIHMGEEYSLSYQSDIQSITKKIIVIAPSDSWNRIKDHLEKTLPKWRSDLIEWLKGGVFRDEEKGTKRPIDKLPHNEILEWIEIDPEGRASLIAHAASPTLDDEFGGKLTRELIQRYGDYDGVKSGVSCNFHSGCWSGPMSNHLKKKREKLRRWLGSGFESEVVDWVEYEIQLIDKDIEREEIKEERDCFE